MFTRRQVEARQRENNPLIAVVQPFHPSARRAMYAASNRGDLKRRTWRGCVMNTAAAEMGQSVSVAHQAAHVFDVPLQCVVDFVKAWDKLRGSDQHCTELLRDALVAVGLFDDRDVTDDRNVTDDRDVTVAAEMVPEHHPARALIDR